MEGSRCEKLSNITQLCEIFCAYEPVPAGNFSATINCRYMAFRVETKDRLNNAGKYK